MGWAYKLLAQFALRRELILGDNCSGTPTLRVILRQSIYVTHLME